MFMFVEASGRMRSGGGLQCSSWRGEQRGQLQRLARRGGGGAGRGGAWAQDGLLYDDVTRCLGRPALTQHRAASQGAELRLLPLTWLLRYRGRHWQKGHAVALVAA